METTLIEAVLAGGIGSTLAVALLAWHRCEKNHKETREIVREVANKMADKQ